MINKLTIQKDRLKKYRKIDMNSISPFDSMNDLTNIDEVHNSPVKFEKTFEIKIGDFFIGHDGYIWLYKKVTLPEKMDDCLVLGYFDFGLTKLNFTEGFESLLYVNNTPYAGVDLNHKEIIFHDLEGQTVELLFMLWSGIDLIDTQNVKEHKIKASDIGYLHEPTDKFFVYAEAIIEALKILPNNSPDYYELQNFLEEAFLIIDWNNIIFYNKVKEALIFLLDKLSSSNKFSKIIINCIGYTQLDIAWLWRVKHGREKAIRSFSTVLNLMKNESEFIFFQPNPQIYKYIKLDCPEIYNQIKNKTLDDKWEIEGAFWTESDCTIPSGESISRQLLYGINFFKKEFNKTSQIAWLPTGAMFSFSLPQILKQCNINFLVTRRKENTLIQDDLFIWRGLDGSEVVVYFLTTPNNNKCSDIFSGDISATSILKTYDQFKNKDATNEVLMPFGFGDGGGGVNLKMLKIIDAFNELPGMPNVKLSSITSFFKSIDKNKIKIYDGELYTDKIDGGFTTNANVKRLNRIIEFKLAETEWLSVLAMLNGEKYDADGITQNWEILLQNQSSNIILGKSLKEVYDDTDEQYKNSYIEVSEIGRSALAVLTTSKENNYTLYNFSSYLRNELIFIRSVANTARTLVNSFVR